MATPVDTYTPPVDSDPFCQSLASDHSAALSTYRVNRIDGGFVVSVPVFIDIRVDDPDAEDAAAAVICASERVRDLELTAELGGVPLDISASAPGA